MTEGPKKLKFNLSAASDQEWDAAIKSLDRSLQNNERMTLRVSLCGDQQRMNMAKMRKMEKLLAAMGGESLCEMVLNYDGQKTADHIVDRLENAAEEKADGLRFVDSLKSVDIVEGSSGGDFWANYGTRCRLTMDLDFDETVTENGTFKEEMAGEMASVLGVDASLIRIESTERGSVIVTVTLCAVGAVMLLFAGWSMEAVSFMVNRRKAAMGGTGEMLTEVVPGDEVLVDWKGQQYAAKVVERTLRVGTGWITVHYVGDPFTFRNTEKLPLNSPRVHLKEPGSTSCYTASLYPDEGGNVSFEVIPLTVSI